MKKISIGVMCYNEEENVELMYKAISEQMAQLPEYDYEIIFSDNDSKDSTQKIIKSIANKDKHVKAIFNLINFGTDRSGVNMSMHATGDAFINIPCDFQEPPEMIPEFIKEWENDADIVWGQKNKSEENPIKYFCRNIFYDIIGAMSEYPQLKQVSGFGLMDRKVLDIIHVTQHQDPEYNARNLVCEYGFKIKLIPYTQQKRLRGKSSYNISKYFHFAITSLCNSSIKPLHIMTVVGALTGVASLGVALFYLVYKLTHWSTFNAGMAPIVIGLFMVSAIQLFCMGILGEYIAVIMKRITNKPLVIEKESLNFDEK